MSDILCECRHELHREFECGDGCRCEHDESEVLRAHIAKLEEGIRIAQGHLRSTTSNWQEQCLFDCDAALAKLLK